MDKQVDASGGTKGKRISPNFKKGATNKQNVKFKGWCEEISRQVYDRIGSKQAHAKASTKHGYSWTNRLHVTLSNPKLLTNIHYADSTMDIQCNSGVSSTAIKEYPPLACRVLFQVMELHGFVFCHNSVFPTHSCAQRYL